MYEFIRTTASRRDQAGKSIDGGADGAAWDKHGYNSAVLGADKYASSQYAEKLLRRLYPGNALAKPQWPWPAGAAMVCGHPHRVS